MTAEVTDAGSFPTQNFNVKAAKKELSQTM